MDFPETKWQGVVLDLQRRDGYSQDMLLTVKQLIDRTGRPIPKNLQKIVTYHYSYFELIT